VEGSGRGTECAQGGLVVDPSIAYFNRVENLSNMMTSAVCAPAEDLITVGASENLVGFHGAKKFRAYPVVAPVRTLPIVDPEEFQMVHQRTDSCSGCYPDKHGSFL
jgi:hypothetical protein